WHRELLTSRVTAGIVGYCWHRAGITGCWHRGLLPASRVIAGITGCCWHPVFSICYSFIRLFANKRIEYKIGSNKVLFLFVNMNKGTLIRLFDYSQLKTKQRET